MPGPPGLPGAPEPDPLLTPLPLPLLEPPPPGPPVVLPPHAKPAAARASARRKRRATPRVEGLTRRTLDELLVSSTHALPGARPHPSGRFDLAFEKRLEQHRLPP